MKYGDYLRTQNNGILSKHIKKISKLNENEILEVLNIEIKIKEEYYCGYCGIKLKNELDDKVNEICWFCGAPNIPDWAYKAIFK